MIQAEAFEALASSSKGITKLRQLILELAVRGLLVPQDPNDEPASVLLEKIAVEKQQLTKDGKTKINNPLPKIEDNEKPFVLPKGWEWERLGNYLVFEYGKAMPAKARSNEGSVDVYGSNGVVGKHDEALITQPCIVIGRKGSAGALNKAFTPSWTTDVAYYVVPPSQINFDYAFLILKSLKLDSLGKGIKPGLNRNEAYALVTALPPFAEQHRIVGKVDELMTLCDQLEQRQSHSSTVHQRLLQTLLESLTQAVDNEAFQKMWAQIVAHFDTLFTTEASVDQLKQVILQLAVMGKLVPQDPNDEPASVLLEKIAEEKARLVKKPKVLPKISEDEKPFELPQDWEWVRFGEVANTRLGKMLDKSKNRGKPKPYLRNTNVQWHRFELDDVKEMRFEDEELDEFRILRGDLLICEGGEPGRCAIWQDSKIDIYFQKAIHRARAYTGIIPEYLQICLTSDAGNGSLTQYFTGATIKHFPGDKLNRYVFPLPPTEEQYRIITRVDELMAICDLLKNRISKSQQTQEHLATAIVEKAVA
jgi:type I restriction enzyme S subunit